MSHFGRGWLIYLSGRVKREDAMNIQNESNKGSSNQGACLSADSAEVLFAYIDGTLDEQQAEALDRHAAGCVPCQTLIDGQRAMWTALDAWEAPELSPDFNRNLHAAVAAAGDRGWRGWLSNVFTVRKLMIPAGALALLVATIAFVQMPQMPQNPEVDQKAGIESNEVRQIEGTLDDLDVLSTLDAAMKGPAEEKL